MPAQHTHAVTLCEYLSHNYVVVFAMRVMRHEHGYATPVFRQRSVRYVLQEVASHPPSLVSFCISLL